MFIMLLSIYIFLGERNLLNSISYNINLFRIWNFSLPHNYFLALPLIITTTTITTTPLHKHHHPQIFQHHFLIPILPIPQVSDLCKLIFSNSNSDAPPFLEPIMQISWFIYVFFLILFSFEAQEYCKSVFSKSPKHIFKSEKTDFKDFLSMWLKIIGLFAFTLICVCCF